MPCKFERNRWFELYHLLPGFLMDTLLNKMFRSLNNIQQIRKFLSEETGKILVHSFVTSHLDYCNSLLYSLPQYQYDRFQRVLNAAARVVCLVPKFDHIPPVLRRLHWLPGWCLRYCSWRWIVRKVDNAIHRINHYPEDSVVFFVNTYPLDSDLSGG